ncbi:MAG: hypothetical protein J2P17_19895, partial [Mycobacterium sp.]|nr:hypothetical protein [Mycobacterium sp.]
MTTTPDSALSLAVEAGGAGALPHDRVPDHSHGRVRCQLQSWLRWSGCPAGRVTSPIEGYRVGGRHASGPAPGWTRISGR